MKKQKFILSDDTVNSYGYRVLTDGIDLEQFRRNPIMLYNHDNYCNLPIGKWEEIDVVDGKLVATASFDEKDDFAMQIASKVEQGILNATSIGFRAIEWSDDPKLLAPGQTRPTVVKAKLREASIVDFPANGNAMRLSITFLEETDIEKILPKLKDATKSNEPPQKMKKVFLALGLSEDATEEQAIAAIGTLKEGVSAATSIVESLAERAGLPKEQVKTLAASNLKATGELVLGELGKQKEQLTRLSDVIEATKGQGHQAPKQERTLSEMMKSDPKGVRSLLLNDREKYKKLFLQDFGVEPTDKELNELLSKD